MRLLFIFAAAFLASAAKLDKTYLPPNAQTSGGSSNFLQTPLKGLNPGSNGISSGLVNNVHTYNNDYSQSNAYGQSLNYAQNGQYFGRAERPRAALEKNAAILRQYNEHNGDNFEHAFETENGIYAEERGVAGANGVEAQGGFTYTGDDGQIYSIKYTADQNGFIAQGDHLPTPHPVPEEILRALEQNARDEAAGIYDDGSYNEAKYGDNTYQYGNSNHGNVNNFNGHDDAVVTNSALFDSGVSGFRNLNIAGNANGLKTYLPPVRGSNLGRNVFGRKPSYSARYGYQY